MYKKKRKFYKKRDKIEVFEQTEDYVTFINRNNDVKVTFSLWDREDLDELHKIADQIYLDSKNKEQ